AIFFFQAEDGIRDFHVTGVQTCALPISLGTPNYGLALRHGIESARGEFIICDEIDLGDTDFYQKALLELEQERADLVVGSKLGRSEERRVGKECMCEWRACHSEYNSMAE